MIMYSFTQMPIAVVGMACRLPGADDLDAFWRLVSRGQSMVQPLPAARFERELYYDPRPGVRGRSYCDKGCLVNYDFRSPQFEHLPDAVRRCPDVAYRTLCAVAAEALADAGWSGGRTDVGGVYIGHTRNSGHSGDIVYSSYVGESARLLEGLAEFRRLPASRQIARDLIDEVRREYPHRDRDGGPELGAGVAAALVAHTCGFDGPCMSFNSACASSLQALAYAVRGLQSGRIDVALVGGASYLHHDTLVLFSQARSLSAEQSRPFDAAADGLIVGEGYAAVVLKTLPQATRDGDTIHAVIRGVGVSSDGKGKSLWAPRQAGQVAALRRAYGLESKDQSQTHNRDQPLPALQYIEAHATSTQLGDATEVAALVEALGTCRDRSVALGSVKANIGHTLETAGLSGLLKTILCLRQRQIPPSVHVRDLNDKIKWRSIPFHVPTQLEDWPAGPAGDVRRAGVSAFGIGGLNVHVVLEEHDARVTAPPYAPKLSSEHAASAPDSIAVVGRGVVLPGALNLAELKQLLASGQDPKSEIDDARWQAAAALCGSPAAGGGRALHKLAGQVTRFAYDWRKHKIPPKQLEQASPLQFMILDAVEQAFAEAGMDPTSLDRARIGVVVGTHFGGEFGNQLLMGLRLPEFQRRLNRRLRDCGCAEATCAAISEQFAAALLAKWPALLDETGSFTSSSLASRITKAFDLMGGAVAVDAAGCSSAAALLCCEEALLAHDCDLMICVGGYEDLSVCRFEHLLLSGRLAQRAAKSPFDAESDGFVPGEGCAVALLMRTSDAQRENRSPQAIVRSIGAATSQAPAQSARLAVERAFSLAQARGRSNPDAPTADQLTPDDITALETTSTGSPGHTLQEIGGIAAGYAGRTSGRPLSLGCLTGQIGYLEAASGLTALVKTTLELQDQQTISTFGIHTGNDAVRCQTPFEVARQPAPLHTFDKQGRLAAAVHNGDDRGAYHILLERGAPVDVRSNQSTTAAADTEATLEFLDSIPYFDATRRRKNRMLAKSQSPARVEPTATDETPTPHAADIPVVDATNNGDGAPAGDRERQLIELLVARTGHPRDAITRDADLEADLGIDWLEKETLLRELRRTWQVTAHDLAPADVVTVGDLLTLLGSRAASASVTHQTSAAPAPSPVAGSSANPISANPTARRSANWSAAKLREFLITFVVEQTGYPADFVELDADLEADLGIDSIKKAMLFGELSEQLEFQPATQLSLDDFPTLRHVLDYLVSELGLSESPAKPTGQHAPSEQSQSAERITQNTWQADESPEPPSVTPPVPPALDSADRQRRLVELMPNYRQMAHKMNLLSSAGLAMPYFCEHERTTQDTTQIAGREVVTFSSSNYLGMSGDPVVVEAAKRAIDAYGTSVSASRLIAGKPIHRELEERLARFLRVEKTLVFSSGYAANETTIAHLFGARDLILHDSLAHNCIIQGAILSGARRLSFPHNNLEMLDRLLSENCHKHRRTLIAIEGAYSMDGDHPDLPRVLELKRRYNAFLLVDDAHAIGTMGSGGRGIAEHFGIAPQEIDLWMGTMSKALGSCGGFLAGCGELIDYLKYNAPGFIYTVALSPASVAAALAALQLLEQQPERVQRLQHNTRYLLKLAHSHGLDTGHAGHTPVVPILFGNSHTALLHSRRLLASGIDIQPIVYPAVENEAARLRFMITAKHTEEQIRLAIQTIVANLDAVAAESVPSENWKSLVSSSASAGVSGSTSAPASAPATAPTTGFSSPVTSAPSVAPPAQRAMAERGPIAARPEPATKAPPPRAEYSSEKPTAAAPRAAAPTDNGRPTSTSDAELRELLVAFVVEHTGYPPDIVELDADLEADLGIDSIKKAQLFGELAEQFELGVAADGQLSLDDFPTLQHILDYVAQQIGVGS